MIVDESCIDDEWPLTVDSGTLSCDDSAVTFTAGGVVYGVNGLAVTFGAAEIDPIWADAEPGPKVNIGPLSALGRELC